MPLLNRVKTLLDRKSFRSVLLPVISHLAKAQGHGVRRIFYDDGIWMHETSSGYFAYHQPYVRLDLPKMDTAARTHFFWGYKPQAGDVVMDVGAGVGEETLTFSRAVGPSGRVICIEAHPRTYRCLEKLVQYNRLENVTALHLAATEPSCALATIEDSKEYLGNRLNAARGFSVPATTLDEVCEKLGLGRIDFLKMNIEGAERFAIRGMAETLRRTATVCVSCHDFLAELAADDDLRTKATVQRFLEQSGFTVTARPEADLTSYLRDQVWAYNERSLQQAS